MIDLISNNPFRLLGVFINTSKKEIISNKGKVIAFARIGKTIPMDTDFPGLLPSVTRNVENITEAESKLALPNDILKYSLFWFCNKTMLDSSAFSYFRNSNREAALNTWNSAKGISSLQNRLVYYLCKEDYIQAFACAEELYTNHAKDFLAEIMSSELMSCTSEDLIHVFCDSMYQAKVIDNTGWMKIDNVLESNTFRTYLKQIRSATYIKSINEIIDRYDCGSDPDENLDNAKNIKAKSAAAVKGLQKVYDKSNPIYQTTMDKLSNAILSKTIAYYNKTSDSDCAVKALPLMEYASSLAVGEQQITRCKTNTKTIKDAADRYNNPPSANSFESLSSSMDYLSALLEEIEIKRFFMPYLRAGHIILGKTWTFEAISYGYKLSEVGDFKQIDFVGFKFVDLFKRGIFDYATYTSYEIEQSKQDYYHFNEAKSFMGWKEFFEKMSFQMEIEEQPYIHNGQTSNFYCGGLSGFNPKWNICIKVNFFEITHSTYASYYYDNIRMNKIDVYTLQSGNKPFLKWLE